MFEGIGEGIGVCPHPPKSSYYDRVQTRGDFREIVRQQWNFSPSGSEREIEDYAVELSEVRVLEMIIVPGKSGGEARARLRRLRLA